MFAQNGSQAEREVCTGRLVKSPGTVLTSPVKSLPGGRMQMMERCSDRVANLAHFLTRNTARWPERPAIVWEGRVWSWKELDTRVSALSQALQTEFQVGKGDRLLVQAPNSNQMIEIMLAAFRIGAVWVPCNFRQAPGEPLMRQRRRRPRFSSATPCMLRKQKRSRLPALTCPEP